MTRKKDGCFITALRIEISGRYGVLPQSATFSPRVLKREVPILIEHNIQVWDETQVLLVESLSNWCKVEDNRTHLIVARTSQSALCNKVEQRTTASASEGAKSIVGASVHPSRRSVRIVDTPLPIQKAKE